MASREEVKVLVVSRAVVDDPLKRQGVLPDHDSDLRWKSGKVCEAKAW